MLSSSLRASLIALVASAAAVCAAPVVDVSLGLHVSVSVGPNINGHPGPLLTVTVDNRSGKTLKLLKDPRGVLDTFPEDSFTITDATGSRPSFNGAKAKYSPTYAAHLDDPSAFFVLPPGASVDVTHDLATAYDFTGSNGKELSIEPSNLFTYVDEDGTPKDFYATVGNIPKVKLSGDLAARAPRDHDKRATFNGCTADQQSLLNTAAIDAQNYASSAFTAIQGTSSGTPRYTTWFGAYNTGRKNTVQSHFGSINGNKFSSFAYDCTCTTADTFAYVYPDQFGTIYLCGAFWNAPATGTDSKAGTLVHEASHFIVNGGTQDNAYGQAACKNLAINNPALAIFNADSHEYFTENTPPLQ